MQVVFGELAHQRYERNVIVIGQQAVRQREERRPVDRILIISATAGVTVTRGTRGQATAGSRRARPRKRGQLEGILVSLVQLYPIVRDGGIVDLQQLEGAVDDLG